jgi:hypothetical protein
LGAEIRNGLEEEEEEKKSKKNMKKTPRVHIEKEVGCSPDRVLTHWRRIESLAFAWNRTTITRSYSA